MMLVFAGILFGPLVYVRTIYQPTKIADIQSADAALVFGALVRNGTISPLHQERLDAAIDLLDRQLVDTIVVSNAQAAANVMAAYVTAQGVSPDAIEIDGRADQTPDTCRTEFARNAPRGVIFVSQSFHIPRLTLQCKFEGVRGQSLAAEDYRTTGDSTLSALRVFQIRAARHAREAILLWTALLGIYKHLD